MTNASSPNRGEQNMRADLHMLQPALTAPRKVM